jgi:hypothetical protein
VTLAGREPVPGLEAVRALMREALQDTPDNGLSAAAADARAR